MGWDLCEGGVAMGSDDVENQKVNKKIDISEM